MAARYQDVVDMARNVGLEVKVWAPGDGARRYRFFRTQGMAPGQTYYGPADGMYTAVGAKEAVAFIQGFELGRRGE